MRKTLLPALILATSLGMTAQGQSLTIMLEPLPPLINEDGSGYSVNVLKAAMDQLGMNYSITTAPYNRAKHELLEQNIDLMGHTPYEYEEEAFYLYAQELSWSIPAITDIYTIDASKLAEATRGSLSIGTVRGNREFMAEISEVPVDNFVEGSLEGVLQMLQSGRVDAVIFERASSMETVRALGYNNIHYSTIMNLPASFAVQNNAAGTALKAQLDDALQQLDINDFIGGYFPYIEMPESGMVP